MTSTEKAAQRAPATDGSDATAAAGDSTEPRSTREAAQDLGDSLQRAWEQARHAVSDLGLHLGKHARNVGEEGRQAAAQARESLHDAVGGLSEHGQAIAEDALELGHAVGASVSRFVRKHPLRSLAMAALAGVVSARLVRRRHR